MNSRVMQWLVLSRDYLQGPTEGASNSLDLPNERTSFPLPSILFNFTESGQATRPPGGSTAHYNFTRVAQATLRCKCWRAMNVKTEPALCNSARIAISRGYKQAPQPVESAVFCGKVLPALLFPPCSFPALQCRGISPKSVIPFTKYCIARATSRRPIMRTRMRMPVSPITWRTRLAAASTK